MYYRGLIITMLVLAAVSCHKPTALTVENHDEHSETKFQYTTYTNDFELFAEADAFFTGKTANVLSHFSTLPDFKPLRNGSVTIILSVNGRDIRQTQEKPVRPGIYSFDIQPETAGKGTLKYEISDEKGFYEVIIPEVTVFSNEKEADVAAENQVVSRVNTTVFTKEQSWKIDFASGFPENSSFGQTIKTTALVQPSQNTEMMVVARTAGIVDLGGNLLTVGKELKSGQVLCRIVSNEMAGDNLSVRFSEAKNNFEKSKADYERLKALAADKVISEKELLVAENQYLNSKAVFDNLSENFNSSGQSVKSPMSGFINQIMVKNGAYAEAGQALFSVSQNNVLQLLVEVSPKYSADLQNLVTATIRCTNTNKVFTLEELNGRILSYGKAANPDNYLIPVTLQIENTGDFVAGSFAEVCLKTSSGKQVLTVPVTAILEEQGIYFVWKQATPELFEKLEVIPGTSDGISIEIIKGIEPSERIVTRGAMFIKLAQATGSLDAHSGHVH